MACDRSQQKACLRSDDVLGQDWASQPLNAESSILFFREFDWRVMVDEEPEEDDEDLEASIEFEKQEGKFIQAAFEGCLTFYQEHGQYSIEDPSGFGISGYADAAIDPVDVLMESYPEIGRCVAQNAFLKEPCISEKQVSLVRSMSR